MTREIERSVEVTAQGHLWLAIRAEGASSFISDGTGRRAYEEALWLQLCEERARSMSDESWRPRSPT